MPDLTQEKVNIPAWISLEEAGKVLNLSSKTIKEHCKSGKLTFKVEKRGKKSDYFIFISSLPKFAQDKLSGKTNELSNYSDAPIWAKVQVEKYLPILQGIQNLKGQDIKRYILNWNELNTNLRTSYPCVMKMKRRYFQEGIS